MSSSPFPSLPIPPHPQGGREGTVELNSESQTGNAKLIVNTENVCNLFITYIDIQNKLHTRFYATSVRKAHYLLDIYLLKSSSTFPSYPPHPHPQGAEKRERKNYNFSCQISNK